MPKLCAIGQNIGQNIRQKVGQKNQTKKSQEISQEIFKNISSKYPQKIYTNILTYISRSHPQILFPERSLKYLLKYHQKKKDPSQMLWIFDSWLIVKSVHPSTYRGLYKVAALVQPIFSSPQIAGQGINASFMAILVNFVGVQMIPMDSY